MEEGNKLDVREYVLFHLQRNTEDLLKEHSIMLKKVENKTSKDFSKNIDYFTEDKYNYIRKKILDIGNESLRDIERHMEMLELELNKEVMEKIRQGRLKKFRINELPGKKIWIEGDSNGKQKFKGKII